MAKIYPHQKKKILIASETLKQMKPWFSTDNLKLAQTGLGSVPQWLNLASDTRL